MVLKYDPAAPEASRDLTRDCIKSDTASVEIPELDLVLQVRVWLVEWGVNPTPNCCSALAQIVA